MTNALQSDPLLDSLRAATLGDYDIYSELGRGGMAVVYLAHDIALDRKVAIKVMLPELLSGDEMVERFKREARTAGALSHPHIIPIHAVKDVDGMLYFVMKFVEGRGLDSIISELGPLPLKMVQTILTQVAGALAHAHRRNVVHRDIKPANVMLDEEGWAVVTDFGIAKVQDAKALTSTGAAIGTPYYMSPEQCSGKNVTGASDQYSLGIMAYEMLTGRTPFNGPSMMEVMSGHFFGAPDPIIGHRSDCPPALEAAILRMLAKEPGDRFATCDEVVSAIAAPALAHDDPVRTQMLTLARSGAALQPRMSVPMSPVPAGRRSRTVPPARTPPRPSVAAKLRLSQRILKRPGVAALGLVMLGAIGAVGGVAIAKLRHGRGSDLAAGTTSAESTRARTASPTSLGLPKDSAAPAGDSAAPAARWQSPVSGSTRTPAIHQPVVTPPRVNQQRQRADSIARARGDSIARAHADSIDRARNDSIARAQRAAAVVTPAVPDSGIVVFGTRASSAVYYVGGAARGVISNLVQLKLKSGPVRLGINAEGCTAWDTTVTVRGGETIRLGYRAPRCP